MSDRHSLGDESLFMEILGLLSLGFIVSLSGAIIPGPLFAFTVHDSTKKGKITGHLIILGHAIWELLIILVIFFGFGSIILQSRTIIYLLGGPVLVLMGLGMIRSHVSKIELRHSRTDSSLIGGIFYTAFNPTQPLWWATAGLALLSKGLEIMSLIGVVLVTAGHWFADFVYYIFVSVMVHKHRNKIVPHQFFLSRVLGIFLILLGGYFVFEAFGYARFL